MSTSFVLLFFGGGLQDSILKIMASLAVAVSGWLIVHLLTRIRAIEDKKRDVWVNYLMDSYITIASNANRAVTTEEARKMEDAIEMIQCIGNDKQIELAKAGNFKELLHELRISLREALGLKKTNQEIRFYRQQGPRNDAPR